MKMCNTYLIFFIHNSSFVGYSITYRYNITCDSGIKNIYREQKYIAFLRFIVSPSPFLPFCFFFFSHILWLDSVTIASSTLRNRRRVNVLISIASYFLFIRSSFLWYKYACIFHNSLFQSHQKVRIYLSYFFCLFYRRNFSFSSFEVNRVYDYI